MILLLLFTLTIKTNSIIILCNNVYNSNSNNCDYNNSINNGDDEVDNNDDNDN